MRAIFITQKIIIFMVRDVRLINASLRADKVDKNVTVWIMRIPSLPYLYCNKIVIKPSVVVIGLGGWVIAIKLAESKKPELQGPFWSQARFFEVDLVLSPTRVAIYKHKSSSVLANRNLCYAI